MSVLLIVTGTLSLAMNLMARPLVMIAHFGQIQEIIHAMVLAPLANIHFMTQMVCRL